LSQHGVQAAINNLDVNGAFSRQKQKEKMLYVPEKLADGLPGPLPRGKAEDGTMNAHGFVTAVLCDNEIRRGILPLNSSSPR